MILTERFKRELDGCIIHDNYIQNSSIDGTPIEYLLFQVGKHYYCLSYSTGYVINEIDSPSRLAYSLTYTIVLSRKDLSEYIKQIKIRNIEN